MAKDLKSSLIERGGSTEKSPGRGETVDTNTIVKEHGTQKA